MDRPDGITAAEWYEAALKMTDQHILRHVGSRCGIAVTTAFLGEGECGHDAPGCGEAYVVVPPSAPDFPAESSYCTPCTGDHHERCISNRDTESMRIRCACFNIDPVAHLILHIATVETVAKGDGKALNPTPPVWFEFARRMLEVGVLVPAGWYCNEARALRAETADSCEHLRPWCGPAYLVVEPAPATSAGRH